MKARLNLTLGAAGLLAVSALSGCGMFSGVGLKVSALPEGISKPCAAPAALVNVTGAAGADLVSIRQLGDALYVCGARHAAAVAAFDDVRRAISER